LRPALNNDRIKHAKERENAMDKKLKQQLIIIYVLLGLSLLMGFVDWLTKASSNITNDLGIWVGSIGTLVAILFVVLNTNKQIENQNRLENRPLLRIESISEVQDTDFDEQTYFQIKSHVVSKHVRDPEFQREEFDALIRTENIGKGIAVELAFFNPILEGFFGTCYGHNINYDARISIRRRIDLSREIKASDMKNVPVRFYYNLDRDNGKRPAKASDLCNTILMYSDIQGHIYMTYVQITFDRYESKGLSTDEFTFQQYYSGCRAFKKAISYYGFSERYLLMKYKERFLDNIES